MAIVEEMAMPLLKPIVVGKGEAAVTYEELKLREPTLGELRKANKAGDSYDVLAKLIQLVCGMPEAAVDRLLQRDMEAAADFFGQFSKDRASSTASPTVAPD